MTTLRTIALSAIALTFTTNVSAAWKTYSKSDDFTDSRNIYSYVRSNGTGYQNDETLWVRCSNGELDVFLNDDRYLGESRGLDVRIDKNEPMNLGTNLSNDGTALFVRPHNVDQFIAQLKSGSRLVTRTKDYRGVTNTANFSLSGSTKAINKALAACKPMLDKKKAEKAKIEDDLAEREMAVNEAMPQLKATLYKKIADNLKGYGEGQCEIEVFVAVFGDEGLVSIVDYNGAESVCSSVNQAMAVTHKIDLPKSLAEARIPNFKMTFTK